MYLLAISLLSSHSGFSVDLGAMWSSNPYIHPSFPDGDDFTTTYLLDFGISTPD